MRGAVAALVAGQAELFNLESHRAFFSTIRATIPLSAIGIGSLLIMLGAGYPAAIAATFLFIGGNYMLHQVLQQFLSSSLGVVAVIGTLILLMNAIQSRFSPAFVLISGVAAGIFGMTSPEAHLFIPLGFCLFLAAAKFFPKHIAGPQLSFKVFCIFGLGFFIGISPLLPHIYRDLFPQSNVISAGHPGDWIARPGYIAQAGGVFPFYTGETHAALFKHFKRVIFPTIPAVLVMLGTLGGIFYLISVPFFSTSLKSRKGAMYFLMGLVSLITYSVGVLFFLKGRGYAMLKVFDWYSFIPAVVLGLSLPDILQVSVSHIYLEH